MDPESSEENKPSEGFKETVQGHVSGGSFGGFSTASGKRVKVSQKALKIAQALWNDVASSNTETISISDNHAPAAEATIFDDTDVDMDNSMLKCDEACVSTSTSVGNNRRGQVKRSSVSASKPVGVSSKKFVPPARIRVTPDLPKPVDSLKRSRSPSEYQSCTNNNNKTLKVNSNVTPTSATSNVSTENKIKDNFGHPAPENFSISESQQLEVLASTLACMEDFEFDVIEDSVIEKSRRCSTFEEIYQSDFSPHLKEFDVVGVIIQTNSQEKGDTVYIANERKNIIAIQLWRTVQAEGIENLVKEGVILAATHLGWRKTSKDGRIPVGYVQDVTVFSVDPTEDYLKAGVQHLKTSIQDMERFISECTRAIREEKVETPKTPPLMRRIQPQINYTMRKNLFHEKDVTF